MRIATTPLPAPLAWPVPRPAAHAAGLRPAILPAPGLAPILEDLGRDGTLVVTTGQQPGLFTGPLYTVHKAVSAAALAALLEQTWGRRVIPVFWLAGDDHDFAEANHASWPTAAGGITTVTLRERPAGAPLVPMYRELLGPEVDQALARLEADLAPSGFRDSTLQWLRRHYRAENTVGAAFGEALAELLAPLGILCLDSTHPVVKQTAAPYLIAALRRARELEDVLDQKSAELAGQGTDPGVAAADGATLVMLESALGRDRLVRDTSGFVTRRGQERFALGDLEAIAARDPQRLSPNVLLRPVVESAILPTVAYVAGPGELRYLPLAAPLYQRLEVVPQLPVPRWSGVLVEQKVDRTLQKFGADLEELMVPGQALENRVVLSQLPDDSREALAALRAALERGYEALARGARAIDPTIEKTIVNLGHQAQAGTQEAERRLVSHLKKRSDTELSQIARARSAVLPNGKPQERVYTAAPFLAREGPTLLGDILQSARSWYATGLEAAIRPA
jgi:bacillithiol biosynthesis cysteine-adding enzyme BshC